MPRSVVVTGVSAALLWFGAGVAAAAPPVAPDWAVSCALLAPAPDGFLPTGIRLDSPPFGIVHGNRPYCRYVETGLLGSRPREVPHPWSEICQQSYGRQSRAYFDAGSDLIGCVDIDPDYSVEARRRAREQLG